MHPLMYSLIFATICRTTLASPHFLGVHKLLHHRDSPNKDLVQRGAVDEVLTGPFILEPGASRRRGKWRREDSTAFAQSGPNGVTKKVTGNGQADATYGGQPVQGLPAQGLPATGATQLKAKKPGVDLNSAAQLLDSLPGIGKITPIGQTSPVQESARQNASTATPGGNKQCNGGFSCLDPKVIGCDVCGNGGCKSQQQYCAAVAKNGQNDQCCMTSPTEGQQQDASVQQPPQQSSPPTQQQSTIQQPPNLGTTQTQNQQCNGGFSTLDAGVIGCDVCGGGGCKTKEQYCLAVKNTHPDPACAQEDATVPDTTPQGGITQPQGGVQPQGDTTPQPTTSTPSTTGGDCTSDCGSDYYVGTLNKYRDMFSLPHFTQDVTLEGPSQRAGDTSNANNNLTHVAEGHAQVMAGGQDGQAGFEECTKMWVCEAIVSQNQAACAGRGDDAAHGGGTGHYELLVGGQAAGLSKVGCAFVAGSGGGGGSGTWTCTMD